MFLFFGVHETLERSDRFSLMAEGGSERQNLLAQTNLYIKSGSSFLVAASEVRDARVIPEVIKQLEKNSKGDRIALFTLVLFLLAVAGSFYISDTTHVYPWTSIISSRRSIICYIHNQDGNK